MDFMMVLAQPWHFRFSIDISVIMSFDLSSFQKIIYALSRTRFVQHPLNPSKHIGKLSGGHSVQAELTPKYHHI
jgi:hypothetical protein